MRKTILSLLFLSSGLLGLCVELRAQDSTSYPYSVESLRWSDRAEDSLAYVKLGEGEQSLIFIHGLGSYFPAWRNNLDTLSKEFTCYAIDLPGYGLSHKGAYEYSMTFFAEVVKGFMDKLSLDKASLVGHSMGGQIALTMALQYPQKVERLILVSSAGFEVFEPSQASLLQSFTSPEYIQNTSDEKIRSNLRSNFYKMPKTAEFMVQDRIQMKKDLSYSKYTQAVSKSVKGMLAEPIHEKLDSIQVPTLIIYGREDNLIPNKFLHGNLNTEKIAQTAQTKIKNSTLALIEEAGHMVHFEKAPEVNALIREFMKRNK